MPETSAIREHMEVIGSDGAHVGTVDCLRGNRIVLSKSDSTAQMEASEARSDRHHCISLDAVDRVDGNRVRLNMAAADAPVFEEAGEE